MSRPLAEHLRGSRQYERFACSVAPEFSVRYLADISARVAEGGTAVNFDGELADWLDIADQHPWTGVLLGNGASMALWPKFGYRTQFQEACDLPDQTSLSQKDRKVWELSTHPELPLSIRI